VAARNFTLLVRLCLNIPITLLIWLGTSGLVVLDRNYLVVYTYDKWNSKELPEFEQGEEFRPSVCELNEGVTSKPNLLTEADLVSLMDKNGIGERGMLVSPLKLSYNFCRDGCDNCTAYSDYH
jgi:hypothetical protein